MGANDKVLGLDIGSVAVSVVEITLEKRITRNFYEFHHGEIAGTLTRILKKINLKNICGVARTSSTPDIIKADQSCDNRLAVMSASDFMHGPVSAILIVGGEKFGLISFDDVGNYMNFAANTSCAAGTGSFLDQQANRLGLKSTAELSALALTNQGQRPPIASRCGVFAKTDLIHAQQEGYSLAQICDGLCRGLAQSIVDTLFAGDKYTKTNFSGQIIFTGGVSRNQAVVKHLSALIGHDLEVEKSCYGATGAALQLLGAFPLESSDAPESIADIITPPVFEKKRFYPPLEFSQTIYPDFDAIQAYEYQPPATISTSRQPVEVDAYASFATSDRQAWLGLDIGSTSTKAVLLAPDNTVQAGFYTTTSGNPLNAARAIFAAIDDLARRNSLELEILGASTTGSGRKFLGNIIGADFIVDEITAHARAAVEIAPEVDTIIEIGGQDSKFTTLQDGQVTFSVMNTVCAAGTGSFIEEQARKLDCPLTDYSRRAEGQPAPLASDRCTVFMERDINYYLSEGYDRDEILTSVLHSIVENYLTKVAIESSIGQTVFFQGATAKNRALVAAFEQRLQKPIHVSQYCHLTGALGAALALKDKRPSITRFKGLALYKKEIPLTNETCQLCANQCQITVATVDQEQVAYGFLCGRDYDSDKYVNNNTSGFNLLRARKKIFAVPPLPTPRPEITIGLPTGLYMAEDLPFWEHFFNKLNLKTITSQNFKGAAKIGKHMTGAEFCSPIAALHGQTDYLLKQADYVFLPFYLEKKTDNKETRRQYCYYTQFAPSLIANVLSPDERRKLLMPLQRYLYSSFHDKMELYQTLKKISPQLNFFKVAAAYDASVEFIKHRRQELTRLYRKQSSPDDLHVVLLGRPYTVLNPDMNKRIPELFGALGTKTFYQDMLPTTDQHDGELKTLLKEVHWDYAAEILKAARLTAQRPGAYPVLVTSFKCTPDSFVMEYFKQIMESYHKPYLILQLDDHDSSVGYETRIEAALRSFKNHHQTKKPPRRQLPVSAPALLPSRDQYLSGKTLLIPDWDNFSLRLVVAALKQAGIDARLLKEDQTLIQKGLRQNSGQCIPLSIIAQECMEYVKNHDLDPAQTVLWSVKSTMACNLALFPHHFKTVFRTHGQGMEKIGVHAGEISFHDISLKLPVNIYFCYLFGGMMRKIGCRIRPYEKNRGDTDRVIENNLNLFARAFEGKLSKEEALDEAITNLENIEQQPHPDPRPLVAIFGDLYVRDNNILNQDLIHYIEDNGGEVVATPFSSYAKMIEKPYLQKWFREKLFLNIFSYKTLITVTRQMEKRYQKYFDRLLPETEPIYEKPQKILSDYHIRNENAGESVENIIKIFYTIKQHPNISLFVQTSPAFCCPSLVTEAMTREIERKTGIPIVSITYDGTSGDKNQAIIPYLKYPRKKISNESPAALRAV